MGRAFCGFLISTTLLLGGIAAGYTPPQLSPGDLVRRVIAHEVQAEKQDNSYWMFRLQQSQSGETKTEQVVETPHGWVQRLLAINAHPLTPQQRKQDEQRRHKLLTDPDEQRKNQEATRNDVQQAQQLLQMLPEAFLYTYAGRQDGIVKLNFRPNPKFHPQSRKATVFHDMAGS